VKDEKYTLIEVSQSELSQWDELVESSGEGTLFSKSNYLLSVGAPFKIFFVMKGDVVKAGVSLMTPTSDICALDDLVIYNGLFFAKDRPSDGVTLQKAYSNKFQITEFVIAELAQGYSQIQLSLAPGFEDLRPFIWHNYGAPNEKQKFKVDVRYTSFLNIHELASGDDEASQLFAQMGSSRRQEIRYARKDQVSVETSTDVHRFLDLYQMTMQKSSSSQEEASPQEKLQRMGNLMSDLIEKKQGFLYCVNNAEGLPVSAAYFGVDSKRAYYLFGANHPELQSRYSGTIVLWDAFIDLAKKDISEVDLEGVNSPRRGWFKLSFGGNLQSYHEVSLG